jgi:hypothetical protein
VKPSRNSSLARIAAFGLACLCALAAPLPSRAQAVSPIDFGTESLGDVRLGVAIATVAQLVDAPALLARSSSQSFVDDAFARLTAATDDARVRADVTRDRDDLRTDGAATFDRARADRDLVALVHDVLHAFAFPRDRLFDVGLLSQQSAYNARVLRSPSTDGEVRHALGAIDVADTLVVGLKAMRERLASVPAGHWSDIATQSGAIVAAILGPSVTPPFPESDAVWLVLFRARPTDIAARRGTPRLFFDVVRFDGTHHTIGAYPAGSGGFTRDAPALVCGFDREGDAASERAIPIVPPPGTTDAQLADELETRCLASAKGTWRYRVSAATDARFIVDLLVNTVPDAASIVRQTAR